MSSFWSSPSSTLDVIGLNLTRHEFIQIHLRTCSFVYPPVSFYHVSQPGCTRLLPTWVRSSASANYFLKIFWVAISTPWLPSFWPRCWEISFSKLGIMFYFDFGQTLSFCWIACSPEEHEYEFKRNGFIHRCRVDQKLSASFGKEHKEPWHMYVRQHMEDPQRLE